MSARELKLSLISKEVRPKWFMRVEPMKGTTGKPETTLWTIWEAAKSRRGMKKHAT